MKHFALLLSVLLVTSLGAPGCDNAAPIETEVYTYRLNGSTVVFVDDIDDFTTTTDPGITEYLNGVENRVLKYERLEFVGEGIWIAHYPAICRDGRDNPITRTIKVRDSNTEGPDVTASFSASVNGLTVHLVNNSVVQNCSTPSYYWTFGDGDSSDDQHPGSHSYDEPGTYTITLRAECGGVTSITSQTITVTDNGGGGNHAPILGTGSVTVSVSSSTSIDLLEVLNAIDPDGNDIDIVSIETPPAGSFTDLNYEAGTVIYHAPSTPIEFTVQVTGTDGELQGVGNLIIQVVSGDPPSCTITATDFDAGNIYGDGPTDVNLLATAVATNCSGQLELRDVRIEPNLPFEMILSQGPGWVRFYAGSTSPGTVITVSGIPHVGSVDGPRVTATFVRR